MNFEPQKFFIGMIDFFSILMPGALLTYMIVKYSGPAFLTDISLNLSGTEGGIAFFLSSYLLGHFVFLLGSSIDYPHDKIRGATYEGQIRSLAEGNEMPWKLTRWISSCIFKENVDKAVIQAMRIKNSYLDPHKTSSAINAFQWCKARLSLDHPQAMATVQRFEADSKFFRSLMVIISIFIPFCIIKGQWVLLLLSIFLLILAFLRYKDQRLKSIDQAYWYIITLEGGCENSHRNQPRSDGVTHAGGVVFRQDGDDVKYLLVQSKNQEEWVLPKGHIEPCEYMRETAVREVHEETGVWACITDELQEVSFSEKGSTSRVKFYLMRALEEDMPGENRKTEWLPFKEAVTRADHSETRELLKSADQQFRQPGHASTKCCRA